MRDHSNFRSLTGAHLPSDARRVVAALWAALALLIGFGWSAIPWLINREEQATWDAARLNGRNLALIFTEQASRAIQSIDQMLVNLAAEIARDGDRVSLPDAFVRYRA